jgi:limonene-1,2-epoxide hydrolase
VSDSPTEIVTKFCDAWGDNDLDALMTFFADDAVYHNIPMEPMTGVDAIKATVTGFMQGVEKIEFRVLNIATNGDVVLTERVDVFHLPGKAIELPVMGTFEVKNGKIAAWRDYFDLNQFMSQMAP